MKTAIILALIFIAFDYLSGIFAALALHTFESSKMRQGLFHKAAILLVIMLGVLCEYAFPHVGITVDIPLVTVICSYIILMETGSIIENIIKVNPDSNSILHDVFGRFLKKEEDNDESAGNT